MVRKPRFPGIDWYCDHCGALLNDQKHFDDHKYTWKCTECGFKNSISWDNIRSGDSAAEKFWLYLIGFLSYVGLWTSVMLAVAIFAFNADRNRYFTLFLYNVGLYVLAFILGIFSEFVLRHTRFSIRNLSFVILRNLKEDILAPFMAFKEVISFLLATLRQKISKKYVWKSNILILSSAIIYAVIFLIEFIVLSRIIRFSLSDWNRLITAAVSSVF